MVCLVIIYVWCHACDGRRKVENRVVFWSTRDRNKRLQCLVHPFHAFQTETFAHKQLFLSHLLLDKARGGGECNHWRWFGSEKGIRKRISYHYISAPSFSELFSNFFIAITWKPNSGPKRLKHVKGSLQSAQQRRQDGRTWRGVVKHLAVIRFFGHAVI